MLAWFMADPLYGIFYVLAVPATVILILQTVMLLFGLGHGDGDLDSDTGGLCDGDHDFEPDSGDGFHTDHDVDIDDGAMQGDTGLRLFTVRGLVAFFSVGGWAGIAALEMGASRVASAAIALVMGIVALVLVALFFKWVLALQYNGTLRFSNAVGKTGEVYMTVPAKNGGRGKVNIIIQEQLTETDAITHCERALRFGERVRVTGMFDETTVIVEPVE